MSEEVSFKKDLVGCFGKPIWENPSEAMVEAAFQHHGLKFRYITTEVAAEDLEAAVKGAKAMGYKGWNCTIPHKIAVIQHLDGLGESAEIMGAVNCVVERDGKYIGENTDGKGFLESLEEITSPEGKNIVLFGAGGASRAVAIELALNGAQKITIVNRSEERGRELADLLKEKTEVEVEFVLWEGDYALPDGTDLVINCTNINLYPNVDERVPVDKTTFRGNMVVADVIPNPPHTNFLKEAEAAGCKTIDGLGMLVNQGKIGIRYWTGIDPDTSVMRAGLEEALPRTRPRQ